MMGGQLSDRDRDKDLNLKAFADAEVVEISKDAEENHREELAQHQSNCRSVHLQSVCDICTPNSAGRAGCSLLPGTVMSAWLYW